MLDVDSSTFLYDSKGNRRSGFSNSKSSSSLKTESDGVVGDLYSAEAADNDVDDDDADEDDADDGDDDDADEGDDDDADEGDEGDDDDDDDLDGIINSKDLCPSGDEGWVSDTNSDFDSDGCQDNSEDDDDDNDKVNDSEDCQALDSELSLWDDCGECVSSDLSDECSSLIFDTNEVASSEELSWEESFSLYHYNNSENVWNKVNLIYDSSTSEFVLSLQDASSLDESDVFEYFSFYDENSSGVIKKSQDEESLSVVFNSSDLCNDTSFSDSCSLSISTDDEGDNSLVSEDLENQGSSFDLSYWDSDETTLTAYDVFSLSAMVNDERVYLCGDYDNEILVLSTSSSSDCMSYFKILPSNYCSESLSVELDDQTDVSCYGGEDGSASLIVTGGSSEYSFDWVGEDGVSDSNSSSPNNLTADTYTVVVSDATCQEESEETITISEANQLSVSFTDPSKLDCFGDSDGSIVTTVSGGSKNYLYSWVLDDSEYSQEGSPDNLIAGTYSLTVTDSECENEIYEEEIVVEEETEILVSATAKDVSCYGADDGEISVSVSGGTGNYEYLWSNNATTSDLSDLGPGTYSLTVTDENSCELVSDDYTVSEPSLLEISSTLTHLSCAGSSDGAIDIEVTGGVVSSAYSYLWNTEDTTQDVSDIADGNCFLTITDDNECELISDVYTIKEPEELSVTVESYTDASCFELDNGSVSISVGGGSGDYSYSWENSSETEVSTVEDPYNFIADDYTLTVTDTTCDNTVEETVSISEPDEIEITSSDITDTSCVDEEDGEIDITVSGGTVSSAYLFTWSNGEETEDITDLGSGDYTVTIEDDEGCQLESDTLTVSDTETVTYYEDSDEDGLGNSNSSTSDYCSSESVVAGESWNAAVTDPNDECDEDENNDRK